MRILFLTHYFHPEGNAPAARAYANCRRWAKLGHQVDVITSAPNVPNGVVYEGYRNRICRTELIDGVRVTRVWTYLAANRGLARRIGNYLSYMASATLAGMLAKRPDVVIATSPQFFNGWAGVVLSRLRRIPFVLEIRDMWPDSIVALGGLKNERLLRMLYGLEDRMYRAADHIVTVGEGYQRDLCDKGVARRRISIIPNGVDKELFSPGEPERAAVEKYCLKDGFTCAYVGTIGMACGLDVVLDAAGRLRQAGRHDVRFLLVGDGARCEELQQRVMAEGLDNVVFTGRVAREQVPEILAAVDGCFVHLRKADLFKRVLPSKIFEMAAMRKPIILGVEGCAAELLQEAGGGICIEPDNAGQLVAAVKQLAGDPSLRRLLGNSGHRYVMEHYDRNTLADTYLEVLARVTRGEQPQGREQKHEDNQRRRRAA